MLGVRADSKGRWVAVVGRFTGRIMLVGRRADCCSGTRIPVPLAYGYAMAEPGGWLHGI